MRQLWGMFFVASLSANIGCGRIASVANTGSVDPGTVFYELYRASDPTTDQTAGAPTSHSSLVGYEGTIGDSDFATNIIAPAIRTGASFFFSLGQCYSGGFLDELVPLGGRQAIVTSARHSETASYGQPAPYGVDVDYTDAFITGLADGKVSAETVARVTAELDPFGPNPALTRVDEPIGSEHTQFYATGSGADLQPATYAQTGMAVLWAGMPAERDGTQMNLMIDRLVKMGFAPDRIWLLYGGGEAALSHPVVQSHMVDQAHPIHLLAATRENLAELFKRTFSKGASQPDFVFFYVGDHGGLDDKSVAKNNFGNPDRLVTPELQIEKGIQLFGDGVNAFR